MRQGIGIAKILADNIRRLRKEANLGQEDLAEKLEVSVPTIKAWETQLRWPGIDHIEKLARFFKVTESELFREPSIHDNFIIESVENLNKAVGLIKPKRHRLEMLPENILRLLEAYPLDRWASLKIALETGIQASNAAKSKRKGK